MQKTPTIGLDVIDADISALDGELDFNVIIRAILDYRESNSTIIDQAFLMIANMDVDGGTF